MESKVEWPGELDTSTKQSRQERKEGMGHAIGVYILLFSVRLDISSW